MISYTKHIKVVADFLAAFLLLSLLSPILIIVTIGFYFVNDGSPFFFQLRPGQNEKLFRIIKFKTMTDKRDAQGKLLSDAERLTSLGKLVRKSSVDELPQLLNVLKGDMSIVGPRPSPKSENIRCPCWRDARLSVRPGGTGLWQVNRTREPMQDFQEWIQYDTEYIRRLSFRLDFEICCRTFLQMGGKIVEKFLGTESTET